MIFHLHHKIFSRAYAICIQIPSKTDSTQSCLPEARVFDIRDYVHVTGFFSAEMYIFLLRHMVEMNAASVLATL